MLGCPRCRATYPDEQAVCPEDGAALLPVEALPAIDPPLAAGDMIGEYRIDRKLGAGTFGEVYAGEHPVIGKRVAIKVLHQKYCSDAEVVSRFISEARAVNRIRHRNIIDIFSFGLHGERRHYFVMELLDGLTLAELLEREGALPPHRALPILSGIASGLDAAHAAGVTHRDLKPENVFLAAEKDGSYFPKLLDFGIAKLGAEDVAHKTATGVAMGTPRYMSPEQCRAKPIDHRADIYALGVLVHEVLTGEPPFEADTAMDLLFKHSLTPPPSMSSMKPDLPSELDGPVLAMLAKRPKDRPDSAGAAIAALVEVARARGLMTPGAAVSAGISGDPNSPSASRPGDTQNTPDQGAKTVSVRARPRPSSAEAVEGDSAPQEVPSLAPEPRTVVDTGSGSDPRSPVSVDAATMEMPSARTSTQIIPTSPGGTLLNEESVPDDAMTAGPSGPTLRSSPASAARTADGGSPLQDGGPAPQAVPPPPPPRAAPKRPIGLIALSVVGVVVALRGTLSLAERSGSGAPVTPPPTVAATTAPPSAAAAPGTVIARISVTPADAVAVIGDRRVDLAREPLTLQRDAGTVLVRFERPGYDATALWFDPRTADTSLATIVLVPAALPEAGAPAQAPSTGPSGKQPVKTGTAVPTSIERPDYAR